MKIVIDIDEENYKSCLTTEYIRKVIYCDLVSAIRKGTILPKGHGDLVDKQSIINQIANTNFWLSSDNWSELMKAINDTTIIIEADKESKFKKCDFCEGGKPLVTGETSDYGISINHISYVGPCLHAYGYDVHGTGSNGLTVKINYCPMCGRLLRYLNAI